MPSLPLDLVLSDGDLTLSRPSEDDIDLLIEACQDPETIRFTSVPSPYGREDAAGYVEHSAETARQGTSLNLFARDPSGSLLASCAVMDIDWTDLTGELGYWVAPWARRRSVATRAARATARRALEDAGLERLHLEAASINRGSNRVAERVGFTHEGTLRAAAVDRSNGERFDMEVWGLLRGELS